MFQRIGIAVLLIALLRVVAAAETGYDMWLRYAQLDPAVAERVREWVQVAGQLVDEWVSDDRVPTRQPDSASSSRRVIAGIFMRTGDEIRITGFTEGDELAELGYVEIRDAAP